jgi:outer membrane lipoprotein-sorting protein
MHVPARSVVAAALLTILTATPGAAMSRDIRDYVCEKLDDFSATVVVIQANQRELGLINRDAGLLYRFHSVQMRYKEPNKVRVDINEQGIRGAFIVSGQLQYVSIPKLGIRTRRDFGNSPGKRKSLMDSGLVSDFYLTYANASFIREGVVDGTPVAVFDLTYKERDEDTSHHTIYIDPKRKVVLKRENYTQTGKLQAIYYFKKLEEVRPGVWFPTRAEAQNVNRVIAGVTEYRNIQVNTGLSDDLFKL